MGGQPVAVESLRERDRWVYSRFVEIPPGGRVTLQFHLEGVIPADETYRLGYVPQPPSTPTGQPPGGGGGWLGDGGGYRLGAHCGRRGRGVRGLRRRVLPPRGDTELVMRAWEHPKRMVDTARYHRAD